MHKSLCVLLCCSCQPISTTPFGLDQILDHWYAIEANDSPQADDLIQRFGDTCINIESKGDMLIVASLVNVPTFQWHTVATDSVDVDHLGTLQFATDTGTSPTLTFLSDYKAFSDYSGGQFYLADCGLVN